MTEKKSSKKISKKQTKKLKKQPKGRKKVNWNIILRSVFAVGLVLSFLSLLLYSTTYHPAQIEEVEVYNPKGVETLVQGQRLKVMSWNVQYMAGKDYVFFYDLLDESGPDTRPSKEDIGITLEEVARVIEDEDPDIILLQEVDENSKRTDHEDQLEKLLDLLPTEYSQASAYYHKAKFVPHSKIMGSVEMKLTTLSKYKISEAKRHQLKLKPDNFIVQELDLKRAVLEVRLPVEGEKDFVVMNTHLSAFSQDSDTLYRQVREIRSIADDLSEEGNPWIIGGDFNLLPNRKAYDILSDEAKEYYQRDTELEIITDSYRSIPSLDEANSLNSAWFTHNPNHPDIDQPDRIIDYIFFSNRVDFGEHSVRQFDTMEISDHFPIIAEIKIP